MEERTTRLNTRFFPFSSHFFPVKFFGYTPKRTVSFYKIFSLPEMCIYCNNTYL